MSLRRSGLPVSSLLHGASREVGLLACGRILVSGWVKETWEVWGKGLTYLSSDGRQ